MEMCFNRVKKRRLSLPCLVLTVTFLIATYLFTPRRDLQRLFGAQLQNERKAWVVPGIHSNNGEILNTTGKHLNETDRLVLDRPNNELNDAWMAGRLTRKEKILGKKLDHGTNCTKVLPQALIVGVMKCGTEALSTFLAIHPEIAMQMKLQTVLFFNKNYAKGYDWYKNQMACSSEGQLTVEKSPQYFAARYVPERIHTMNSSVKLIMIVRDPIKRAISHYTHVVDTKPGRYPDSFEKTVMNPLGKIDQEHEAILMSLYSIQMKRWLQYFKMDQIHIVNGDNFKENPAEELNKLEDFLGIRQYITQDFFIYNSEKGFFCLNVAGRSKGCMALGKGRKHPEINPDVFEELKQYFKPYNEEFFDIIGQEFDWGY